MVASDRISIFDFVLDSTIPDKGELLTRMSLWWFDQLADLVPHHVVSTDVPESVRGRAVICERLGMYPVECVARGYLTGTGLLDYRATSGSGHSVCGIPLPAGLEDGSRLPEPIFTPADQGRPGRARRERVVRRRGRDRRRRAGRRAAPPHARGLRPGRDDRPRARHHPGRHQARVRLARRRDHGARRRGAHPRLVAVLAGRGVAAGPHAAVVRQADRAQLGAVPGVGLGPRPRARPRRRCPHEVVERTRARYVEAYELLTGTTF